MTHALIVEDDVALQSLYDRILSINGYETLCADDGNVAIHYLENNPFPELIILDIRMPNCNGYEVLKYLQAHPHSNNVHVVIATATSEYKSYCDMLPSSEFLLKPVLPAHLQTIVKAIKTH